MALQPVIIALTDDLMVGTRITGTLGAAGYAVQLVGDAEALLTAAREGRGASAVVLPFAARTVDGVAAIRALRADALRTAATLPILAFGPHVDAAARAAATAAGATRTVPNGAFFTRMPALIAALLAGTPPTAEDEAETPDV